MAKNSNKDKIHEMLREIRNMSGIIDDRKRKQLELKYGDLSTLNLHIRMHNDKINRKNKKNKSFKIKDNILGHNDETKIISSQKKISKNISKPKSSRFSSQKKQSINISNSKPSRINSQKKKSKNKLVKKPAIQNLQKDQIDIISEISDSIKEGYEYIILEANARNSEIAVKLAEDFENSIILTANEKGQNRYNRMYNLRNNSKIHLSNHIDAFDELDNISKRKLLIIDDAHRLDDNIVNLFSYTIDLSRYNSLINQFEYDVKELEDQNPSVWLDFFNHLSLKDKWIDRVIECIKKNPDNWICSYGDYNYPKLSFYPLNIGYLAKKHWFSKGEICLFISPTIMDFEKFTDELGLDNSKVKFIHRDLPLTSQNNRIYAKNSVDMNKDYNKELLIPIIEKILENHENEKGLIYTDKSDYTYYIKNHIDDKRLMTYANFNYFNKFQEFKNSLNSVIISNYLEDGIDFPYTDCKFQIIIKEHYGSFNKRAELKEEKAHWYSYKQMTGILQMFQRVIVSKDDYCKIYVLDENILKSIRLDILENKFIPQYVLDLIVDVDMENNGLISDNIKKQFGVYYLFDYIVSKREKYKNYDSNDKELSKKIWAYKDYNKEKPNIFLDEFKLFTIELMKAISELSNQVIDESIEKLALICVPSSTSKRDKSASIRESINCITNWYNEGKAHSDFGLKKQIVNCGDLLVRINDVTTSHLAKNDESRPSYGEHMKSIKCNENEILEMDDVAFIILDDISTRGTIMNACEDKLIQKGVNKENIYKFALFKTLW